MPPRRDRSAGRGGSSPCARARGGGSAHRRARSAARARARCSGGRPAPRRRRGRSCRARRRRVDRAVTGEAPGSSAARRSRSSPPSSLTVASISSMKSGLPSAAAGSARARRPSSCAPPASREINSSQSVAGERLEQDRRRVQLAAAPAGSQLEQLGPGDAEEEDRRVARPVGDVLDQVEEDRLRPLDVVEHEDLWPLRGPASISLRNASCVSAGELPITSPGSTPIASRISTSGQ